MNQILESSKALIDSQLKSQIILSGFHTNKIVSKFFVSSNEKIDRYLKLANISGKEKTLTITGSGDQVFSLLSKGITDIDTFDVNLLAEYYAFGLKKALILRYDYFTFCQVMEIFIADGLDSGNINELVSQIIIDSLCVMDEKYRDFWRSIIDYNWQAQQMSGSDINIMHLLGIINVDLDYSLFYNSYLQSREAYDRMRQSLSKSNISFQLANAVNIGTKFAKKYDLLCLSNVLDFVQNVWGYNWDYSQLAEYMRSLDNITNPDSLIFLQYIFDYHPDCELFNNSNVYLDDLEDLEVHKLPQDNPLFIEDDAVILKRKKC